LDKRRRQSSPRPTSVTAISRSGIRRHDVGLGRFFVFTYYYILFMYIFYLEYFLLFFVFQTCHSPCVYRAGLFLFFFLVASLLGFFFVFFRVNVALHLGLFFDFLIILALTLFIF